MDETTRTTEKRREINRRSLLAAAGAAGLTVAAIAAKGRAGAAEREGEKMDKKAVVIGMLPDSLSLADRFKLCRDCGYDGVESYPEPDIKKAEEMRGAAEKAGIEIHSVMFGGWGAPLSHPDPEVAQRGEDELKACLRGAKAMGASSVLLVPAIVNAETRYVDAYARSQARIRKVIPVAAEVQVPVLIEVVWNKFLLSPLEFARYIDELKSPWVQAYFDVGNVVDFGWSEDWILTLGKRIKRIHLKDFKRGPRQFVNLTEGDVDWKKVRDAIRTVGYTGYYTAELNGGDEAYLKDVAARIDRILSM